MIVKTARDCPPNCRYHLKTMNQLKSRQPSGKKLERDRQVRKSTVSKDAKLSCTRCSSARGSYSQKQSGRKKSPTQFSTNAEGKKPISPFYVQRQSPVIAVKTVADTPQSAIQLANDKMQQLDRVIAQMKETAMMMKMGGQLRNPLPSTRIYDKPIECALFPIDHENYEQPFDRRGSLNYRIQRSNKIYQNIRKMQLERNSSAKRRPSLF